MEIIIKYIRTYPLKANVGEDTWKKEGQVGIFYRRDQSERFKFHRVMGLYNDRAQMEKVFPAWWCTQARLRRPTIPYWIKPTATVAIKKRRQRNPPPVVFRGSTQGVSETVLLLIGRKTVLWKKNIQSDSVFHFFSAEIRKCFWLRINDEVFFFF